MVFGPVRGVLCMVLGTGIPVSTCACFCAESCSGDIPLKTDRANPSHRYTDSSQRGPRLAFH